ncbi:MAG TPA: FapA family protein, partial [Deferrisomatales bacterium]|nr:FapA family protein [Deferrisomatales bacterium]
PGVLVAQGRPPRDGREIDFELLVDAEQKVGKELEGGRIDFREAESVKNVTRGEKLARVIPAIQPEQGYRVDGEMLRPKMSHAQGLKPGQNTVLSEDGTLVLADGDGMLVVQGGKFHLADQYLVNGDVNYTTGNIRATGSVTIRGQVKPGFEVEAGKDVEIQGDVEEARVITAGNLTVRGGITASSVVAAEQNIVARYIQSSTVETGGNLEVKLSVTNSKVYVRGQMSVSGSQGAIVGGEVNAALGIEARDIGSPSAKTHVAVGVDLRVIRELEEIAKEREGNQQTMEHLQASLGRAFLKDPRGTLAAIPAALRKPKLDMLQKMQDLYKREKQLAARDAELQMINGEMRLAQITVQGAIHAGTVITISQLRHVLKEDLRRVVLYYDADKNQVAWRRL